MTCLSLTALLHPVMTTVGLVFMQVNLEAIKTMALFGDVYIDVCTTLERSCTMALVRYGYCLESKHEESSP